MAKKKKRKKELKRQQKLDIKVISEEEAAKQIQDKMNTIEKGQTHV